MNTTPKNPASAQYESTIERQTKIQQWSLLGFLVIDLLVTIFVLPDAFENGLTLNWFGFAAYIENDFLIFVLLILFPTLAIGLLSVIIEAILTSVRAKIDTLSITHTIMLQNEQILRSLHNENGVTPTNDSSGITANDSDSVVVVPTSKDTIFCPICHFEQPSSRKVCWQCGTKFTADQPEAAEERQASVDPHLIPVWVHPESGLITCPTCGEQQPDNRFSCRSCRQIFINKQPTIPYWCGKCGQPGPFEGTKCSRCDSTSRIFNK